MHLEQNLFNSFKTLPASGFGALRLLVQLLHRARQAI